MKARTARVHYLVMFVLAFVAVAVFSAITAISAVFPFAFTSVRDFLAEKLAEQEKRVPAVKAAKAKKEALKKEQAKLKKDQKKLAKKQKKAMDKRVKRIYEERVANGYEASLKMIDSDVEAEKSKASKKAVKAPKSKHTTAKPVPVVSEKKAEPVVETVSDPIMAPIVEKKTKAVEPVAVEPVAEEPRVTTAMDFAASFGAESDDYTSNGSMFRGISF